MTLGVGTGNDRGEKWHSDNIKNTILYSVPWCPGVPRYALIVGLVLSVCLFDREQQIGVKFKAEANRFPLCNEHVLQLCNERSHPLPAPNTGVGAQNSPYLAPLGAVQFLTLLCTSHSALAVHCATSLGIFWSATVRRSKGVTGNWEFIRSQELWPWPWPWTYYY